MSAQKFLFLLGKIQKLPHSFGKEKRFIYFSGPGEAPSGDEKPPAPERPPSAIEDDREREKAGAKDSRDAETEEIKRDTLDVAPIDIDFMKLKDGTKESQEIFDRYIEKAEDLSAIYIQHLIEFAEKSEKKEANFEEIIDLIDDRKITAGDLTEKSKKILIDYFKDDEDNLELIIETALSGNGVLSTTELLRACDGKKALVEKIFDYVKTQEYRKMLPDDAYAVLLNNLNDSNRKETITFISETNKVSLLKHPNLKNSDKRFLFNELFNEKAGDLSKISSANLETLIQFAFSNDENKTSQEAITTNLKAKGSEKVIKELSTISAVTLIKESKDEQLIEAIITALGESTRKEILANQLVDNETLKKLWEHSTEKDSMPEPKSLREKRAEKAKEKSKDFVETNTSAEAKLQTAGFEIKRYKKGASVTFHIPEGGPLRSFRYTSKFKKKIESCKSELEVKLACYEHLLGIITKDKSINTNRWKIDGFRESNAAMVQEIARLEALISAREKGDEISDDDIARINEKATQDLTAAVIGSEKITADGTKTTGEIYDDLSEKWKGTKKAPFTKEEFVTANGGADAKPEGAVIMPFKGFRAIEASGPSEKTKEYSDIKELSMSEVLLDKDSDQLFVVENGIVYQINTKYGNLVKVDKTSKDTESFARVGIITAGGSFSLIDTTIDSKSTKELHENFRSKQEEFKLSTPEKLRLRRFGLVHEVLHQTEELASEIGKEIGRTITIPHEATSKTLSPYSTQHLISVDGEKTYYVLEIVAKENLKSEDKFDIEVAIKKSGDQSVKTEKWDSGKIKRGLKEAVGQIPDQRPVENPEAVVKKLEENGLVLSATEKSSLDKLTKHQFATLEKAALDIKYAFEKADNAYAIINVLTQHGRELDKVLSTFDKEDKKFISLFNVKFKFISSDTELQWLHDEEENNGFGKEDELIKTILKIKEQQLSPEEYEKFAETTTSRNIETSRARAREAKITDTDYILKYRELTTKAHQLNEKIGDMDGDDMEKYWKQFTGHRRVEQVMMKYPFNIKQEQVRNIATTMICGDGGLDLNSRIYFEDIFDDMGGFPAFQAKHKDLLSSDLLKDGDDFADYFHELMTKPGGPTPKEQKQLEAMYTDIIVPCLELLEAISQMKFPEGGIKTELSDDERLHKGLAEGQDQTINGLKSLFNYSEKPAGGWDKFLAWAAGHDSEITMSTANGKIFQLDEGMFMRYYNPASALDAFINTPTLYTLNEQGEKVLIPEKVVAEVNRIMKIGYVQLVLQATLRTGKTSDEIQKDPQYGLQEKDFQISKVEDLAQIGEKQFIAFQFGFVNEKITKFEKKISETAETLGEEAPPAVKAIIEKLKGKVPQKQLDIIQARLIGVGYMHFHNSGDGYEVAGFGLGTGIPIEDGYTLTIGAGANFKGEPPVLVGIGLDIEVYKDGTSVIGVQPQISILGPSVMLHGTHEIGKGVEFGWSFGLGLSWADMMSAGVGAGLSLSWGKAMLYAQKENLTKDAFEKSGLGKEVWESWHTLPKYGTTENPGKWELIQKHPRFAELSTLMEKYPEYLDKDMLLTGITTYMKDVEATEIYDKMWALPLPTGISVGTAAVFTGLAVGGPAGLLVAFIGGLKWPLGTVTVFIPHPREEAKILSQISNAAIEAKVKQIFADMKEGKVEMTFQEKTPDIYYRPGSGLGKGIRIENHEIDLSGLETGIESYNKGLKEAEVHLSRNPKNNSVELHVDNDDDKDVEIHIDPVLKQLGLVVDDNNGRIFIEGNIDDLIISRERFEFPRKLAEGQASIRDVITIRQARSLKGKRDRIWISENEGAFLEKVLGSGSKYEWQPGANMEAGQANIIRAKGYSEGQIEPSVAETISKLKESNPDLSDRIDSTVTEKWTGQIKDMRGVLGTKIETEYQKERTMNDAELTAKFDTLYKDKAFYSEFVKDTNLGNPDNIAKLIQEHGKKHGLESISAKELNMAVSFMLNEWFTTLYKGNLEKDLGDAEKRIINKKLVVRLKQVRDYTAKKYKAEFTAVKSKHPELIESSAEEMVNTMMQDIYGDLLTLLTKEPPIDFRKVMKVGDSLKAGDVLVSGTRAKKGGKTVRELGSTVNYEELPKDSKLAHAFGFLALNVENPQEFLKTHGLESFEIGKEYKLTDPGIKGDIAKALLEIASPIPEEDIELLKTPLALKILGLGAYRLMVEAKDSSIDGKEEQYIAMTEIAKNPTKISEFPDAMKRFRELIKRIRQSQLEGKPFTIETTKGLTVVLDMTNTKIETGAYTKCGNPSYSLREQGTIKVLKPHKVTSALDVTHEVMDVELSKRLVEFSLFAGFSSSAPERRREEPEPAHEGGVEGGTPTADDTTAPPSVGDDLQGSGSLGGN